MRYSRFEQVPVWQAAFELGVSVLEFTDHPAFSGLGDIRNQLQRAVVSIGNNIAEGFERGTTNDLITFVYYAKGSCGEVRSMLLTCQRLKRFSSELDRVANFIGQSEAISRQLAGWADALQNSEIKGIRYLNDSVRDESQRRQSRAVFEQHLRDVVEKGRIAREQNTAGLNGAAPTP